MSGLRVNTLRGASTGTSPTFPDGVIVSGVTTSTSFSGNVTGNVTGNVVGNVTGDVTGNVTGTTGTFTGNVSVGGTLTYDDVTNVDSVGVITARSGIRIGAGQSVSAVSGIVTYYGDGSQLTGVTAGGESNFVASGTIPNGATVILKTDGTATVVVQTGSANPSVGSEVVFNSAASEATACTYDSNSGKVVIAYRDGGNGGDGTAIVGTVSGSSISFGSAVTFTTNAVSYIAATFDSTNNKVVIAYKDDTDNNKGKANVGTVSGTSISFGSAVVFNNGSTIWLGSTHDSTSGKTVIVYKDASNSNHGTAIVGTVSGTSISFGSEAVFNTAEVQYTNVVYDSTNNKVVIVYQDDGNSNHGTAIVGTISGTSISFGSEAVFNAGSTALTTIAFDSTNGKVVIAYQDTANSEYGTARVGTVSGTNIIFGSEVVFESGTTYHISIRYDSNNQKVVISYSDYGDSKKGKSVVGTVSGTSISFGTPVLWESGESFYTSSTYDSANGKVVIAYMDQSNSNYGKAVVFGATTQTTNLTTENYIGIAAEAIANGATGKVNILGGVNSGQTGLTTAKTYYVQPTGTLATSAGNPSVVAGTSISNTKILIR